MTRKQAFRYRIYGFFYPDGIYTAPTEADLIKDIELSFAAGMVQDFTKKYSKHAFYIIVIVWATLYGANIPTGA